MRELEDITTLSDSHKRYVVVNDGKGISDELTERLIADIKRGMQSSEIPEPMFIPVSNLDFIDECPATGISHDYRVEMIPADMDYPNNGLSRRVIQCRYCGHELQEETPPGEIADEREYPITRSDLIICSVLLVVAVITIAAHWIFGG